jgi:hypothetical protein
MWEDMKFSYHWNQVLVAYNLVDTILVDLKVEFDSWRSIKIIIGPQMNVAFTN